MRTETKRKFLMGAFWLLLIANTIYLIGNKVFKTGAEEGRTELISQLNQPELRVTHLSRDDIQLVMIEQRMAQGDFRRQRVEIDVSTTSGMKAERLGSSGSGRYGYMDEVALWRIKNDTDREFPLTEAEFTNLPDGFRLPKNFDGDFIIPPNPRS
jgi:hypothetical protein